MIYLDHNATTRPTPGVVAAVRRGLEELWQNPSSVHRAGQAVRREVELARQAMADLLGVKAREITFTSGGTEAIDLAIRGVLGAISPTASRRGLVTTRVEHAAVRDLAEHLAREGVNVKYVPLDANGLVDLGALRDMLDAGVAILSVQWANNETGVLQPIEEIAAIAGERGVLFHCDATQVVGKVPVARDAGPPCDVLTCSAHKFHGPKGVGVLWARNGVRIRPRIAGTQELGRRGGTENAPGIMGAGEAAREALAWLENSGARERQRGLRDRFETLVRAGVSDAVINGASAPRLWNTSNIGFPRLEAEAVLMLLSERGVCASAGAACSSGSLEPSPVLLAMGVPAEVAHGSVRFSLSRETTSEEIEEAAPIVVHCVRKLRGEMA